MCNDLDKKQQVLSDLYFTLILAENADSFLLRRRENVLPSSSWDPCQIWASFLCDAKLVLVHAVVARSLSCSDCQQCSPRTTAHRALCFARAHAADAMKGQLTRAPRLLGQSMWGLLVDRSSGGGGAEPNANVAEDGRITDFRRDLWEVSRPASCSKQV